MSDEDAEIEKRRQAVPVRTILTIDVGGMTREQQVAAVAKWRAFLKKHEPQKS